MAIIELENLAKTYRVYRKAEGLAASLRGLVRRRYRPVEAVKGISLTVDEGQFVAFLGPNGAGKTTTLKMLSGVVNPTSGTAHVMGFVPWERRHAYRRQFALVMGQKNQLWWDLPAAESFRLHQQIYGIDPDIFARTQHELVTLLDIGSLIHQPVRELSLGERMKMELVTALLHRPRVLFLDEPTIGLDVVAQHSIRTFLRDYQEQYGVTVLLTSHYMKDVLALCRRVVVIAQGKIMYDGSLAGITDRFGGHKIVTFEFAGDVTGEIDAELEAQGHILSREGPRLRLRIDRRAVTSVLGRVLATHAIEDVSVEDPPLEEVIAEVFASVDTASKLDDAVGNVIPGTSVTKGGDRRS